MVKSAYKRFIINKAIVWKHASEYNYQDVLTKGRIIGYTPDEWIHQRQLSNAYLQVLEVIDKLPNELDWEEIRDHLIPTCDRLYENGSRELWCAYYDVINNASWIANRA